MYNSSHLFCQLENNFEKLLKFIILKLLLCLHVTPVKRSSSLKAFQPDYKKARLELCYINSHLHVTRPSIRFLHMFVQSRFVKGSNSQILGQQDIAESSMSLCTLRKIQNNIFNGDNPYILTSMQQRNCQGRTLGKIRANIECIPFSLFWILDRYIGTSMFHSQQSYSCHELSTTVFNKF